MLSFDESMTLTPDQLWLEILESEQIAARQRSQTCAYSNENARERAYLNDLCLQAIRRWLSTDMEVTDPVYASPQEHELPSIWDVVNGVALVLGTTRMVLIPSATTTLEALVVPQEWIDIPNWAADYYLAIHVNAADQCLQVLGYATYEQLKTNADYDPSDRTYNLLQENLIEDLTVMWIGQVVSPNPKPDVNPCFDIGARTAHHLVEQLSQITRYSPRLDASVEEWAFLMADPTWRQDLYERRTQSRETPVRAAIAQAANWLQHFLNQGWELLQDVLQEPPALVYSAKGRNPNSQGMQKQISLAGYTFAVTLRHEFSQETDADVKVCLSIDGVEGAIPLPTTLHVSLQFMDPDTQEPVIPVRYQLEPGCSSLTLPELLGTPGEHYQLILQLGDDEIQESCVVPSWSSQD